MKRFFLLISFSLVFFLAAAGSSVAAEAKTGTVSGQLMIKGGGPMGGGIASLFREESGPPPDPVRWWRVPDHIIKMDGSGRFTADVEEGHYYIGAIKRAKGAEGAGPPQEGDYLISSQDEKGVPKSYVVKAGKSIDIGVLALGVPWKAPAKSSAEISAIEGTVLWPDGKPVKGAHVYAFKAASDVGKPVFISDAGTGADGRYFLRVEGGKTYHLKVREVYGGGPPIAGEAMGQYGENDPVPVEVGKGSVLKGINITVMKFPKRGPQKE